LVTDDGYVITAKHVIDAFGDLKLTAPDGQELEVGRKRVGIGIPGPNTPNVRGTFSVFAYELVDVDPVHDLALLKIQRNTVISSYVGLAVIQGGHPQSIPTVQPQAAAKLSSKRPEEGEPIAVSGYPLRKTVLITTSGAVASSWDYDVKEVQSPGAPDWFRLPNIADSYLADMHVNPGNSGGPVYSVENGAVIGVCVACCLHTTS
jgi:S1-C subfamily serine protease